MNNFTDMNKIIKDSFIQYSGAVLQSRALVDSRDCLKPSTRQIFYCMYTDKFLSTKPFKKTNKAIGSAFRMYIHGDSSATGIMMRSGQGFTMRYPLTEIEGNGGNLMTSGNWASPRYTAVRLSPYIEKMFESIDCNTIDEWLDNYDDTEKYPIVLPSKGFYNIVNGSMGIGIGLASNIPQFNIKDVNNALITLLKNPKCSFEDIYCCPDFATGGYLINEEEVKNSLRYGSKSAAAVAGKTGGSCKLRAKMEFDEKDNCFIVTEMPYGVYTNTVCKQLEKIISTPELNPGIDRFNDLTGKTPNLKIYLEPNASKDYIEYYLYKNTSLQSHFAINLTMLENGRYPKVFTWKNALQTHIDHEKLVYTNELNYKLDKALKRIHIIDGMQMCTNNIDDVIKIIKGSASPAAAKSKLKDKYDFSDLQVDAILKITLSRLSKLEVDKLEKERNELVTYTEDIKSILDNENKFNQHLINEWQRVIDTLGDERRTKVIEVGTSQFDMEDVDVEENVVVTLYDNMTFTIEPQVSYEKKNSPNIKRVISTTSFGTIFVFTSYGKYYGINLKKLIKENDILSMFSYLNLDYDEQILDIAAAVESNVVTFVTRNAKIKVTPFDKLIKSRYQKNGKQLIALDDNDVVISATTNKKGEDDTFVISNKGYVLRRKYYRPTGIGTKGNIMKKLTSNEYIMFAGDTKDYTDKQIGIYEEDAVLPMMLDIFDIKPSITPSGKGKCVTNNESTIDKIAIFNK